MAFSKLFTKKTWVDKKVGRSTPINAAALNAKEEMLDKMDDLLTDIANTIARFSSLGGLCEVYTGDLNDIAKTSIYNTETSKALHSPSGVWGFVITFMHSYANTHGIQFFVNMLGTKVLYVRQKESGVWNDWVKFNTKQNILNTYDEIAANTSEENIAGALVVKELYENGNRGVEKRLAYISSTRMGCIHEGFLEEYGMPVAVRLFQAPETPYGAVTSISHYVVESDLKIEVTGSGFVQGHILAVAVYYIKRH